MTVNAYLFSAYVVIWTILFVYLCFLHKKHREVNRQLNELVDMLAKEKQEQD